MPNKKSWLDSGIESITRNPAYEGKIIVKNALPQKMSGVLLDFAKPLLDSFDQNDRIALKSAIQMSITVWNYSIVIGRENPSFADRINKKALKSMIARAFSGDIGESVLSALLERKQSRYPENNRMIADFNIEWDDSQNSYHLTVMSAN